MGKGGIASSARGSSGIASSSRGSGIASSARGSSGIARGSRGTSGIASSSRGSGGIATSSRQSSGIASSSRVQSKFEKSAAPWVRSSERHERSGGKGDSKGKGKGKGKGKKGKGKFRAAPLNSQFWERKKDSENRNELIGEFTGTVAKYVFKQGWGYIEPDDPSSLPSEAKTAMEASVAEAKENGKEVTNESWVYFRKPDVDPEMFPLEAETACTFELYTDDKGCGAHKIGSA